MYYIEKSEACYYARISRQMVHVCIYLQTVRQCFPLIGVVEGMDGNNVITDLEAA